MDEAFFTLHRGLPREGPGLPDDVRWALDEGGLRGAARVIDAGCGPGADLVTLAEELPEARIEGLDAAPHLVAQAQARVAHFGGRVTARVGDMAALAGPLDLIWCAGAIYNLGIGPALRAWRPHLAPRGAVAFSEPVWPHEPPSDAARAFWAGEYDGITGMDGIVQRVTGAGFRVAAARLLTPAAWAAYYVPLSARAAALRPGADATLAAVLDEAETEIARWRAAPDEITYAQVLAVPS